MKSYIGSPYNWLGIYGRVVGTKGGLIEFATPHGTRWEMGWAVFTREAKPLAEDVNGLATVAELEQLARDLGVTALYCGRLPDLQ